MQMTSTGLGLLLVAAAGCGMSTGDDDTTNPPDPRPLVCPTEGRYFPMVEGATWTFKVTDSDGNVADKISRVGAKEDVGGVKAGMMAFKVTTSTASGGTTESWQEDTGSEIRRHRELDLSGATHNEDVYQPFKLRLDESSAHTAAGAEWTLSYDEIHTNLSTQVTKTTAKTDRWTVEASDAEVVVPAGHYCALQVRRTSTVGEDAGSDKTYWFVRGIGKVKEVGGSTEELASFEIP